MKNLGKKILPILLTSSLLLINKDFKKSISVEPFYHGLEDRLEKEGNLPNYLADKFALIVIGSKEPRHRLNGQKCYQTLLENKWDPKNIYVLSKFEKEFFYPVDGVLTKKNFIKLLNFFANKIDDKDLFLLYLNGHGGEITKNNKKIKLTRFFFEEWITDEEIDPYLSVICPKKFISFFDFCSSGSFAKRFEYTNQISIAGTTSFKHSYSAINNSFSYFFWEGLSHRDKKEKDYNKDGRISLKEAFDYAKKNNYSPKFSQIPIYYSQEDLDKIFIDEYWNKPKPRAYLSRFDDFLSKLGL